MYAEYDDVDVDGKWNPFITHLSDYDVNGFDDDGSGQYV